MGLFEKLFGRSEPVKTITLQQVQDLFAYGKQENVTGGSLPGDAFAALGNNISWKSEPGYYKGYKDIPPHDVPPHIKWFNNPLFAYVAIVEGELEYHYGDENASDIYHCPVTTNPEHICLIAEMFHAWYQHFDLPHALQRAPKKAIDRSDKMKLIGEYIIDGSPDFLYEAFGGAYDIVMVVDWREEDDAIVDYCEDILLTGELSASPEDNTLLIHYRGDTHVVNYPGRGADRDTTLISLNKIIQPDYEIRLFKASLVGDTLFFLPLSAAQWDTLEAQYGKGKVDALFGKVIEGIVMFG